MNGLGQTSPLEAGGTGTVSTPERLLSYFSSFRLHRAPLLSTGFKSALRPTLDNIIISLLGNVKRDWKEIYGYF